MRTSQERSAMVLFFMLLTACSQADNRAGLDQRPDDTGPLAENNCPPEKYVDIDALDEEQLSPLFEIAKFSLDGQLTREDFDSNPRYAEIALFGAEFLATTDVTIGGIVSVTSTPPISKVGAAKLAEKLARLKVKGRYSRAGVMGTLQAKTKTCFLLIKNDLP